MKRKILIILALLGLILGGYIYANSNSDYNDCPFKGTPDCPEYPLCCK